MSTIDIDYLLQKDFSYYRKLPPESRTLFKSRIAQFIKGTEFQGRQGLEITDTMKILVSATAVQLTFGFNSYYNYDHFSKIILYPDKYVSKHTGQLHTGEMNTGGAIVFSWKHFYEGIKTDNDSRNVGLHEFAHALDFMDKAQLGINDYFAHTIDKIKVVGRHYIHHQPEKPFFRSYAATNSSEFFAVGTEYFFEAPIEFRKEMPELYNLYCTAYRQQPQPKVDLPVKTQLRDDYMGGQEGKYSFDQKLSVVGWGLLFVIQFLYWLIIPYIQTKGIQIDVNPIYYIATVFLLGISVVPMFQVEIGFYNHKIRVFTPLWKALFRLLFGQKNIFYTEIPMNDLLLIDVNENDTRDASYTVTCTYLYQNKLKHSSWSTSSIVGMHWLFRRYYNEYKIAFREDDAVKKYEIK